MFFDGPACALGLELVCDEEDINERCFELDFEDFVERADIMEEVSAMIRYRKWREAKKRNSKREEE